MSNEEANSVYLCTVRDYHGIRCPSRMQVVHPLNQWNGTEEMGVDGQDNRETGGSDSDRIFFMKYPMSFLQQWYGTFPPVQEDTTTTVTSDVFSPSVGVHTDMEGESSLGDTVFVPGDNLSFYIGQKH